jgi:lysophospholipid acyltransferase (LPLAT)-like uncharacterized protein
MTSRPTLRRRIARSPGVAAGLAWAIALWLRFCRATTRWQVEGEADLRAALAKGPVILVLWHECTMLAPVDWPRDAGPLSSLRDTSPVGQVSGAVQARFGLLPMAMSGTAQNRNASRQILRRVAEGVSIGLTGDGPLGPARVLKDAPLDWARATGVPVFLYAFGTRRHRRLGTWDRMILPLPFTRGVRLFRRWSDGLPRRPDDMAALRADLTAALNQLTDQAAARAGRA